MLKLDELQDPESCWNRAHDNEMVFAILGRDAAAPTTIRFWAWERIRLGKNLPTDLQILNALSAADRIENDHRVAAVMAKSAGKAAGRPEWP
jgi:hypothetical protein